MNRNTLIINKALCARLVLIHCVVILVGCSKPTPVELNKVCQKENDDAYVAVEGYLRIGASVLCSSREGTRSCGLELLERADGGGKISVFVEEGTGNNQMEPLPNGYITENLKIRARDGQILGPQDRVRIIGIAKNGGEIVDSSYSICYVNVEKIEKP